MEEVVPPWVQYPGFCPMDGFWRQSGKLWLWYVWLPYWQSLNEHEKKAYLNRWNAPQEWLQYSHHINPDFLSDADD